ncbi:MAG: TlpA disulfide reductase family protein [Pyrinomonadaceae bacterium]
MTLNKLIEPRNIFWTMRRVALTAFSASLLLFVASSCTSGDISNETAANNAKTSANGGPKVAVSSQPGAPRITTTASESIPAEVLNATIEDTDGKSFRLADYKDKVVVLDLWATWCGPCRLEIPHLIDLSNEYGPKGVVVIGLTTEERQQAEEVVQDFAREFKINYRVGWGRQVAPALMQGSNSIPQTFVIAPGGRIIFRQRGYSADIAAKIRAAVDKAKETTGD